MFYHDPETCSRIWLSAISDRNSDSQRLGPRPIVIYLDKRTQCVSISKSSCDHRSHQCLSNSTVSTVSWMRQDPFCRKKNFESDSEYYSNTRHATPSLTSNANHGIPVVFGRRCHAADKGETKGLCQEILAMNRSPKNVLGFFLEYSQNINASALLRLHLTRIDVVDGYWAIIAFFQGRSAMPYLA